MEKWASKWLKCVLRYTDFTNFSGGGPLPLIVHEPDNFLLPVMESKSNTNFL